MPAAAGVGTETVHVATPEAVLAVVPYLLSFEPHDSIVVIGVELPHNKAGMVMRYDLPDPADPEVAGEIARHATAVLAVRDIEVAVMVGYGPEPLVSPVVDALRECAAVTGLRIMDMIRAEDGHYWSYLGTDPASWSAEGMPYDMDHPAARALSAEWGERPVFASRAELAAQAAPVSGEEARLMRQATRRATERALSLVRATGATNGGSVRLLDASAGVEAVKEAIAAYRHGERFPAGDSAAWLSVVLLSLQVRDDAWCRMDPEHRVDHLRLWTDITRLAQPGYVAPSASLLAFVAWQTGNGALANIALDRALDDEPGYRMAELLRKAIDAGAPPSLARIPMTPEEVAESYSARQSAP